MLGFLRLVSLVAVFFLSLLGDVSVYAIMKSLFFAILSILISFAVLPRTYKRQIFRLKTSFVYYTFWLFKEIFVSSIQMIKIIITPGSIKNIVPVIDKINTIQDNDIAKAAFANSITTTPGTITISIKNDELIVHAINESYIKSLVRSPMDKLIKNICV